jgi:hypothetical protein
MRARLSFYLALFVLAPLWSRAQGVVSLGLNYDGWQTTNTLAPYNGAEGFAPFSINYVLGSHWDFYTQTSLAAGRYTDSLNGTEIQNLTNLTATTLGGQYYFMSFGFSSMAELDLTVPTGDPSWETKQIGANVPSLFIPSRYSDEGWGVSGLYGVSLSEGRAVKYGVALGYYYFGAYNPDAGSLQDIQFKIGDSFFLALNRTEMFPANQSSVFRLTATAARPSYENGISDYQMGPNLAGSYSFYDPMGFCWGLGAQVYSLAQRHYFDGLGNPVYGTEPYGSSGAQFYAMPGYNFFNLSVNGILKFVTANGYPLWDSSGLYNGGGWLLGLAPGYYLPLDKQTALSLSGGIDYIIAHNAAYDFSLNEAVDLRYFYWTLGATYQIKM